MEELIDILSKEPNAVLNSFARALEYSKKIKDEPKEEETNE